MKKEGIHFGTWDVVSGKRTGMEIDDDKTNVSKQEQIDDKV